MAATLTLLTLSSNAGTVISSKAPAEQPPAVDTGFDKIWSLATLYKSKTNPYLQKLAISGRYHGQYALLDSDQGNFDDWENRRFRIGLGGQVFQDFEFKAEMLGDLNPGGDFYTGLTEVYLAWKPDDAVKVMVGKQKPRFTLDWDMSSREISTLERSILLNNFGIDYETGISVSGNFAYFAGAFNNDVGETGGASEFGDLGGAFSYVANLSYDFKDSVGMEKAVLRGDFIHTEHNSNDELLSKFDNGFAASLALKQGRVSLTTEAIYAQGDKGDIWGFYLTPTYDVTKKFQLVARYTYGHSPDDVLRLQSRYERKVDGLSDSGNGETYHAGYLGANY
jgi:phosphate-selective porin OprO and OprP